IRCYECHDGRSAIFRLREHVDRLYGSAHVLDLPMPFPREQLIEACLETVRANRLRECYIRPIAFLGDGEMGLAARPATRVAVAQLLAELGIPCREERFTRDEVYLADEAFFTGTAAEVTPIRELDDRCIGDGKPGPTTRRLQELFFAIVRGRDDRRRSWLAYV